MLAPVRVLVVDDHVDVVVMDARMPVVDGFQAAPLLRARRPGLPILLVLELAGRA